MKRIEMPLFSSEENKKRLFEQQNIGKLERWTKSLEGHLILRPNDKRAELLFRLFVNGKTVTEPTQVAKELSTFFAGIG